MQWRHSTELLTPTALLHAMSHPHQNANVPDPEIGTDSVLSRGIVLVSF